MLATRYSRNVDAGEVNEEPSLVETAGYIPAEEQIMQMISAGVRLGEYREEAYDFGPDEEVDLGAMDPTRRPGFDLADASSGLQAAAERLSQAAAELQAASEAGKSEPEGEAK